MQYRVLVRIGKDLWEVYTGESVESYNLAKAYNLNFGCIVVYEYTENDCTICVLRQPV